MVLGDHVDVVERWSERIAQRFAPEEIDFAAEVGKAYATGGQARKDLLPRHNVQPGAFGAGAFATELPWVLQALDQASKALIAVLRSQYLGNALAAGSLLVALRRDRGHGQVPDNPGSDAFQVSAELPGPEPALPGNERQAVGYAFDCLSDRLKSAGFAEPRAGQLAHGLLEELLADAAGAAAFLDALTAASEGDGQRDPETRSPAGRLPGLRRGQR